MSTLYVPRDERIHFGNVLRDWFERNNWAQDVPHKLATANGWAGPWNSQISCVFRGALDPKPQFFVALAEFNLHIAHQHFPNITNRRTLDQLKGSEPLRHNNGDIYTATDFFALFIGTEPF
jgi:hypothetical protein